MTIRELINKLEESSLLEDTVISFVGDHYPYTLTIDEINELSDYKRDETIEVNPKVDDKLYKPE